MSRRLVAAVSCHAGGGARRVRTTVALTLLLCPAVSGSGAEYTVVPQRWVAMNGDLAVVAGASDGGVLRWRFTYEDEPSVITCASEVAWKIARRVILDVRSDRKEPLFIRFDQSDGKVFLTYFEVTQAWQRVVLASGDFQPYGAGVTGTIDFALVDRVFLVDLNGSDGDARGERTVWLRRMSLAAAERPDRVIADAPKPSAAVARSRLTYVDLVKRLTDLEGLAVLPSPGERCGLWSSYDRHSRYEADTGEYLDWGANKDGVGAIRMQGASAVLAEMNGPGCITRIWSADPGSGPVKIYLDGSDDPAVAIPFEQYFDRSQSPFDLPSLVYHSAKGANCYVPIPYQKSCKVVAEPGWGMFYQFTYTTFPKGTVVPTFTRPLDEVSRNALIAAGSFLQNQLGTDPAAPRGGSVTETRTVTLRAGQTVTLADLEGPRAITAIKMHPQSLSSADAAAVLRAVSLSITWDGETSPAVWAPVGDFFGTAPGVNHYRSLPLGMTEDAFYSFWYMPFSKRALVSLTNDGVQSCSFEVEITHVPLTVPARRLGRFHAKWHRDAQPPTDPVRWMDWTLLDTRGRGRFCGVALHVWNPRGHWWGEGDEKFFVDGERFPSMFGTGSEDYFGYAWCSPEVFHRPFHSQTRNDGENRGHISVNRWQIADSVPFQDSFRGVIEKYLLNRGLTLYATTVYWYLAPGGDDPYERAPMDVRSNYYAEPDIHLEEDAIEGEQLRVLAVTDGEAARQELFNYEGKWSDDAQLFWSGARPGDRLTLALPVRERGKYDILVRLTKASDYGIVRFSLDGKDIGDVHDLYNATVTPGEVLSLGTRALTAGDHKLVVSIVGANTSATRAYMFGLDWVKLRRRSP